MYNSRTRSKSLGDDVATSRSWSNTIPVLFQEREEIELRSRSYLARHRPRGRRVSKDTTKQTLNNHRVAQQTTNNSTTGIKELADDLFATCPFYCSRVKTMSTESMPPSTSTKPTMSRTLREAVSKAYCDQMRAWEKRGDHLRSAGWPESDKATSCANSNSISREINTAYEGEPDWPEIQALFAKYGSPGTSGDSLSCQE